MKKRVLPLVLALALILPLPVLGAEEPAAQTYEQAVAELRERDNYVIDKFLDCELCSVFLGRWVGTPHSTYHSLSLVYKAGSPLGDGGTVELPLQKDNEYWGTTLYPSTIGLTEDKSGLRYTYYSPEVGTDVYSVDLATGQVTTAHIPPSYEEVLEAQTWGWNVERQLEAPSCTVVLMWSELCGAPEMVRDYALLLVTKEDVTPEERAQRLLLPSTAAVKGEFASQYPTHRVPDSLSLNVDGSVLTYVYSFEEALFNADGETLHEAGTYTYRVETATGELTVSHTPLPSPALGAEGTTFVDVDPGDWFARGVADCAREGIMTGTGADAFSPEATLTYPECVMLAYRLYDRAHGGDGSLLKAPEGWGYMTLETDDGSLCYGGFGGDPYVWGSFFPDGPTGRALLYLLPRDEEMNDLFFRIPLDSGATVTLEGKSFHGTVSILRMPMSHTHYFTFSPDELSADQELLPAVNIPAGDKWWRDLAYTVKQRGWEELFPLYPQAHTAIRYTFASQLDAVVDLPRRFEVPVIPDLSREDFPQVFRLYEAGILGGTDNYGTFTGGGELTRAEAAVMAARVLDESLRLREPPRPMPSPETGGYTLTYLADGSLSWYSADRQPFCCLERRTGEDESGPVGFLTLEGELTPWEEIVPKGMEWDGMERQGPYVRIWLRDRETEELFAGILDENARWVVPPGEYDSVWVLEEGFGASSGWGEEVRFFLLDGEGQVIRQAEYDDPAIAAPEYYPQPQPWGGVTAPSGWLPGRRYYQWPDGSPASGWFDDCGELSPDGRGFVEKDGRVYRIQFET